MINPHIVRKPSNPSAAPPEAGMHWINTLTNEEFFSVGTSSVTDWIPRRRSGFILYTVVITQQNLNDKSLTLPHTPISSESVSISFVNGTSQVNGIDYEVSGNVVSWEDMGLDNFIELNDVLIVQH
jgi:hypothetical protein